MEDSRRNVHQRSSKEESMTKRRNSKKKRQLVKVVYISNPMHFKASAAEFKGLVQHFTGQDSDVDAELFKFAGADHYSPVDADADRASSFSTDDDSAAALSRPAAGAALQQEEAEPYRWAEVLPPFDAFDDEVFSPQALENLAAFMPTAASLCYEHPRYL